VIMVAVYRHIRTCWGKNSLLSSLLPQGWDTQYTLVDKVSLIVAFSHIRMPRNGLFLTKLPVLGVTRYISNALRNNITFSS